MSEDMSGQVTDALGLPGVGIHAHRTLGLATVDVAATVVAAALIALIPWHFGARRTYVLRFGVTFAALMALGVLAHVAFRVPTALNRAIGLA